MEFIDSLWQTAWFKPALVASAVTLVVAGFGGWATVIDEWYLGLRQARWKPPDWAFGPIWTVILGLATASAVMGWLLSETLLQRVVLVLLFGINCVFNMLWSVLYFRMRRPDWALVEVLGLWLSVLAPLLWLLPMSPLAAAMLLPYLAWVTAAALLNRIAVRLNGPFGPEAAHTRQQT